jgi:hypothetical protein
MQKLNILELATNDTLHNLISKMFIDMIVAINMQTKTQLKPPKKTRKITNL